MTVWLTLAKSLLSIADGLIGYLANKRLLNAGQAEAAAKGLREAIDVLEEARRSRDAVRRDGDKLDELRDKFRTPRD